MTAIDHVLAPLDGTPAAEAALRWIQHLPLHRLTLLRVCERESPPSDEAEAYLQSVAERFNATERSVQTRVLAGCPAESIVEAARVADLVVMATGAHGGGGRLLFGSVADRVARHSPTPTLLLRHGTVPDQPTAIRRIVVPLDGSPAAQRALLPATVLAGALECPIHVVNVDESDDSAIPESQLQQLARTLSTGGQTATSERRSGGAASELLKAVSFGDLLVLTTHGRGAQRRWQIGSVAEKLLRQATAPVVLVRADLP
jgi:nucleotide-binding universal stress UspA family protein